MNQRKIKSSFLSGLIIGAITHVVALLLNTVLSKLLQTTIIDADIAYLYGTVGGVSTRMVLWQNLAGVLFLTIGFVIAGVVVFTLIEKVKFKVGKTILIALLISLVAKFISAFCLLEVMLMKMPYSFITISNLIYYVLLLLGGLWINAENIKKDKRLIVENGVVNMAEFGKGYFNMVGHILLLIFTGGIWLMRWIYRTTKFLNCVPGEEHRSPVGKWLLCFFVPFYWIYWTYVSAQRIDKLAKTVRVQSDISTLCLIFAIIMPIISFALMQDKINNIVNAGKKMNGLEPQPVTNVAKPVAVATGSSADELKKYKELLDMGAITPEEYEAKKKQLLGL